MQNIHTKKTSQQASCTGRITTSTGGATRRYILEKHGGREAERAFPEKANRNGHNQTCVAQCPVLTSQQNLLKKATSTGIPECQQEKSQAAHSVLQRWHFGKVVKVWTYSFHCSCWDLIEMSPTVVEVNSKCFAPVCGVLHYLAVLVTKWPPSLLFSFPRMYGTYARCLTVMWMWTSMARICEDHTPGHCTPPFQANTHTKKRNLFLINILETIPVLFSLALIFPCFLATHRCKVQVSSWSSCHWGLLKTLVIEYVGLVNAQI